MRSTLSSNWLSSYIKATWTVLEIFKIYQYFLVSLRTNVLSICKYIGLYTYPEKYTDDANSIFVTIILFWRNKIPSGVNNMHFQSKPE
jgi:hypothetical protein